MKAFVMYQKVIHKRVCISSIDKTQWKSSICCFLFCSNETTFSHENILIIPIHCRFFAVIHQHLSYHRPNYVDFLQKNSFWILGVSPDKRHAFVLMDSKHYYFNQNLTKKMRTYFCVFSFFRMRHHTQSQFTGIIIASSYVLNNNNNDVRTKRGRKKHNNTESQRRQEQMIAKWPNGGGFRKDNVSARGWTEHTTWYTQTQ